MTEMSRAPKNESPASIPLNSVIGPYGMVDFADSSVAGLHASPAPGGVVGGPPAYLEAHGIRYIPSAPTELDSRCGSDSLESSHADMESSYVSPEELNSRVDDRIKQFMQTSSTAPLVRMDNGGSRQSMRTPYSSGSPSQLRSSYAPSRSSTYSPSAPMRSSYDDYRNSLRSSTRDTAPMCASSRPSFYEPSTLRSSAGGRTASRNEDPIGARLRALRRECEASTSPSSSRRLASSASDDNVSTRLRSLRHECEMAAAGGSRSISSGASGRSFLDF
jgi:hypothetical protein